ncbi:MAG: type II toxin-antitoxin system VapC family toxin [Deltaproteobacteria bacterium]|nr:type II toxin-antitoxin system VapC family toxin [Deltaproteobacteria bacterium]
MRTAVDSSVLLDVLIGDARFADASEEALRRAAGEGALVIGECVLAETIPAIGASAVVEFLADWNLEFVPSTAESATLAGEMYQGYLRRSPRSGARVLPDFLIGAHAVCLADRLLARDRGYYRDYFKRLRLVEPPARR